LKKSCGLPRNKKNIPAFQFKNQKNLPGYLENKKILVARTFLVWVLTLLIPPGVHSTAESQPPYCITADAQFAYALSLYDRTEYPDSVVEFRRFIQFFSDDVRTETAWYHIGMSFFHTGQYLRAVRSFQTLIETFGQTMLGVKSHFKISESYLKLNDTGQALIALFNLITLADDSDVKNAAYYQAGWIYLEMAQWDKARAAFENISPGDQDHFGVKVLLDHLESRLKLKNKDPKFAGLLAVVPGVGHLYCERYRDALTAFVVNGLLAWAAWEAFDKDSPALGSAIAVVGFGFYAGSIFGSVSAAHKFNQEQTRHFIDQLKSEVKVTLSASPRLDGGVLMAHFFF